MTGPQYADAPPPEVPEEFGAAYREAYRQALADSAQDVPEAPPNGASRAPQWLEDWRGERWFRPAVFAVTALVLILGAYAVGAALSDPQGQDAGSRPGRTQLAGSPGSGGPAKSAPGSISPVEVGAISADCTAPPGVDSAGRRITYGPEHAVDGSLTSAWRCPGTAVGQKLVLRLGRDVDVAQVGLVPGYAKTDPASGVDRYAENNRITRVRWTLDDGVQVVQRLDPDPSSRAMQVLRVPRTTTDTVVLEILGVQRGARNTTAISTIGLWAAR